jgi:hypothetical protein
MRDSLAKYKEEELVENGMASFFFYRLAIDEYKKESKLECSKM